MKARISVDIDIVGNNLADCEAKVVKHLKLVPSMDYDVVDTEVLEDDTEEDDE